MIRFCGILSFLTVSSVLGQGGAPVTPEKVYAFASTRVELPCMPDSPGQKLVWSADHEDKSLISRSSVSLDYDMVQKVIEDVRPSDAGTFTCTSGFGSSSVELIVLDGLSAPRQVNAKITGQDTAKVTWKAPQKNSNHVTGYKLYVTEVGKDAQEVTFDVEASSDSGREEFLLEDLAPGTTYEIEAAAQYPEGPANLNENREGPRSKKLRFSTPTFNSPPSRVSVKPAANSTITVRWQPPSNVDPSYISGYKIFFTSVGRKKTRPVIKEVNRPAPSGQWSTIVEDLPTKNRYKVEVAAISKDGNQGKKSAAITYRHDGFPPEISLSALPLSPETVMLTFDTVGFAKVDKLRLLYSDESATKWSRVKSYKAKERYAIVTGLQPRTRYFFMAKGRVNKKARQVVTHAVTPPSGLEAPSNVSVTAQSDNSVGVTWNHDGPATGYIVKVERQLPSGQYGPDKQKVVFGETEAYVDGLYDDEKYQVKVVPFDRSGAAVASEPVLFHIAASESEITTTAPVQEAPKIVQDPPKVLQISAGDDVKLTCSAIGNPNPTVTWYRDGSKIGADGDRTNELFVQGVQQSTVLMCVATNSLGSVYKQTKVEVSQGIELPPDFRERAPNKLMIKRGTAIKLPCRVVGNPPPTITWYKDGIPLPEYSNRMEYAERNVNKSATITCRAENTYGSLEASTKVLIEEYLIPPRVVREETAPNKMTVYRGDDVKLPCVFTGNPSPSVTWLFGNRRISKVRVSRNVLTLNNIAASGEFVCRGVNDQGVSEKAVKVTVRERPRQTTTTTTTETPSRPSEYVVNAKTYPVTPTQVEVKWSVDRGDLDQLRAFDATLMGPTGTVLMRQRLGPDQRIILLSRLTPGRRYTLNLQTLSNSGVVHNETRIIVPQAVDRSQMTHEDTSVVEVRSNSARINFATLDTDAGYSYRLRMQDLDLGLAQNTLFDQQYPANSPSLKIERLQPLRRYRVIVDAIPQRRGQPAMSSVMEFRTPAAGDYGRPASSSWSGDQTREVQTTTLRDIMRTEPATPAPIVDDGRYKLNLRTPNRTPYQVFIRWTVDRGDLDKIENFVVTIKGETGRTLLEQELQTKQRSITIQSLRPSTRYDIKLKARGREGVLAEADLPFVTASADTTSVQSPVLDLEANEIRPTHVRLDWLVVNSKPGQVTSYRLTVRDEGPNGPKLLQEVLNLNSQSLHLQKLAPNRRYHATVDAIGGDGRNLLTASLAFHTPSDGQYGIPQRSSSGFDTTGATSQGGLPASTKDSREPALDMEIAQADRSTARLTWDLVGRPVRVDGYRVKIRANGPSGQTLLERDMPASTAYFNMQQLQPGQVYYVELSALDSRNQPMLTVGHPYRLGSPPVRISSANQDVLSPEGTGDTRSSGGSRTPGQTPGNGYPKLDLEINPVGGTSASLNWKLQGGERSLAGYKVTVRQNGPTGFVLVEDDLTSFINRYQVDQLQRGQLYYIQVDALANNRVPFVAVGAPFLVPPPGSSYQPIKASSSGSQPQPPTGTDGGRPQIHEPILDITVQSEGAASARLTWELTGPGHSAVAYRVKVYDSDKSGQVLLTDQFPLATTHFVINGLQRRRQYYVELEALAQNGRPLLVAGAKYRLPRPGSQSPPTRGSSVTTDQSGGMAVQPPPLRRTFAPPPPPTTRAPPRSSISRDLKVERVQAVGQSGLYVKWRPEDGGAYTSSTMLRFAKMLPGNQRGQFQIRFIPPGSDSTTITGLDSNQVYGVQVGAMTSQSQGQYVRWSPMMMGTTN